MTFENLKAAILNGAVGAVDNHKRMAKLKPKPVPLEFMVAATYLSGIRGVLGALENGENVASIKDAVKAIETDLHMKPYDPFAKEKN